MLRPSPSDRTCWEGHHAQHWIAYSLVSYICSLFLAGVRFQSCMRLILTVRTVGIVPFPEVLSGPMAKFSLFALRLIWSLFSSVLSFLMVRVSKIRIISAHSRDAELPSCISINSIHHPHIHRTREHPNFEVQLPL